MSTPSTGSSGPSDLMMLCDFQHETVWMVLPILCLAGVLSVANAANLREPLHGVITGLALFSMVGAAWSVQRWCYRAAAWVLLLGLVALDLAAVMWMQLGSAICLLALPVGLAALAVSIGAGIGLASGCTIMILLLPPQYVAFAPGLRSMTVLEVWGTLVLIWLTLRPLLTTLEWSWASCEQSRQLLERARDSQVQLKQTLEDLADANLQLARLNRLTQGLRQAAEEARLAKQQFVANVSHELRTPLNMIIGFSEMMVNASSTYGRRLPPALLSDLGVIARNSQHLSSLVDDVLDLSQIEAEQMALTREHVQLLEIIEAAVMAVQPLFESKGLYLEMDIPPNATVYCDRTRIREVVLNLLSNAGRFTEHGGVHVRAWKERNDYVVSVADTGPGISTQDQERIFQPFQQIDSSLRRRYGGTGLGLAISKSFVELHGGRMWVQSEPGVGTTFYFRLPVESVAPTENSVARWFNPHWHYEERVHRSLAPVSSLRPRWVVVDPGSVLPRLLARYRSDVEIAPVTTLEAALQELARAPAQALVANGLPVTELLAQLKGAGALPYGTPAVCCSLPGFADAAGALGAAGYLVKPISREVLLSTLDRLSLAGNTILIVDDEPEALQLFWRMLNSAGRDYRVLTAPNGREALKVLREDHPDAVLLDLVMPDMDGFAFLEAQKQDPLLNTIPVVLVSACDPTGQPVVSDTLAVMRGGGLTVPQVLASIEALTRLLAPADGNSRPAPAAASPG